MYSNDLFGKEDNDAVLLLSNGIERLDVSAEKSSADYRIESSQGRRGMEMSLETSMSFGISREMQNSEENNSSPTFQQSYAPTPSNSYVQSTITEMYNRNKENVALDIGQTNQAFLAMQQAEQHNDLPRQDSDWGQHFRGFNPQPSDMSKDTSLSPFGSQLDFSKGIPFGDISIGIEPDQALLGQQSTGISREDYFLKQDSYGISQEQQIPQQRNQITLEPVQDLLQQGSIGIEQPLSPQHEDTNKSSAPHRQHENEIQFTKGESNDFERQEEQEKIAVQEHATKQIPSSFAENVKMTELLQQQHLQQEPAQILAPNGIPTQYQQVRYESNEALPHLQKNFSSFQEAGSPNQLAYSNEYFSSQDHAAQATAVPEYQTTQQQFPSFAELQQEAVHLNSLEPQPLLPQFQQTVANPLQINPIECVDCPSLIILNQPQKKLVKQKSIEPISIRVLPSMPLEVIVELVVVENGNAIPNEPRGNRKIVTNEAGLGVFKDLKIGDATTAAFESLFQLRFSVPSNKNITPVLTDSISVYSHSSNCSEGHKIGTYDLPITINSVTPSSGRCGDTVVIRGNFSVFSHQKLFVTFNNKPAGGVSLFNSMTIVCTVPDGSGAVKVIVRGGKQSASADFVYL